MDKKLRVAIVTGSGQMGYAARMLLEIERLGLADVVVIDVTRPATLLGIDFAFVDELAPLKSYAENLTTPKPSAKRRALMAQLERAKLHRDKNAIRDLTRQLEKVL
jgi:hypothetical protein